MRGIFLIHVFESNNAQQGRLLFPTCGQFWQEIVQKGNVITTPLIQDLAGSEVIQSAVSGHRKIS
jgi:hypothetical protein